MPLLLLAAVRGSGAPAPPALGIRARFFRQQRSILMTRKLLFLALPILFAVPMAQAGGKTDPPALLVQVRSAERVLDHVKLILSLIERQDIAEKVEAMLKAKIGPEGVAGVDLKRPLGVAVSFIKGEDIQIAPLILVPISDEKAFLKLLETNKVKVTRGKNDIFTADVPSGDIPLEFYFRFA